MASNHGLTGTLYVTCLYYPNNGNFVTDEIWDANLANQTWIEAGIQSGEDYNGNYDNKDWFWAKQLPGANYMEYDSTVQANLTTEYPVEITYAGGDSWDVYGESNFSEIGTAVSSSYNPTQALGGTEYTSNSGSGLRDIANIYNLANQGLNGTWYSLGSAASNENLGPGNYIGGNYNSVASEESWSGPC